MQCENSSLLLEASQKSVLEKCDTSEKKTWQEKTAALYELEENYSVCFVLYNFRGNSGPIRKRYYKKTISNDDVLTYFSYHLTAFEKQEIKEHTAIFYWGYNANIMSKLRLEEFGQYSNTECVNHGYRFINGDHILYRYEFIKIIGEGTFGQVVMAYDYDTEKQVAIKFSRKKTSYTVQGLNEFKKASNLNEKEKRSKKSFFISVLNSFFFRGYFCIVYELCDSDLAQLLADYLYPAANLRTTVALGYQILKAVDKMHACHYIHTDLKPENILVTGRKDCVFPKLKISDFGSCVGVSSDKNMPVQSLFYRSPEVIMGLKYGKKIDMWSVGCILAELWTKDVLFKGVDNEDQLWCIMEVLGVPPESLLKGLAAQPSTATTFNKTALQSSASFINRLGLFRYVSSRSLRSVLGESAPDELVGLIERCLEWSPRSRITAREALKSEVFYGLLKQGGLLTKLLGPVDASERLTMDNEYCMSHEDGTFRYYEA